MKLILPKILTSSRLRTFALFAVLMVCVNEAAVADIRYIKAFSFDEPVVTGDMASAGVWYPDRYRPADFESTTMGERTVLKMRIENADGAQDRPSNFSSGFYNTQGRKYDLPSSATMLSGELYFPASWQGADVRRRADIWATGTDESDGVTLYPIIGIANNDGTPVIRYWDTLAGDWVVTGIVPVPNTWYRFDFFLEGGEIIFLVNGVEVGRHDANGASKFANVILNAYNYNDTALGASYSDNAEDYDVYWDNVSYLYQILNGVSVSVADTTVGLRQERSRMSKRVNFRQTVPIYFSITNSGGRGGKFTSQIVSGSHTQLRVFASSNGARRNVTAKMKSGAFESDLNPDETEIVRADVGLKASRKKIAARRFRDFVDVTRCVSKSSLTPRASDLALARILFDGPRKPRRLVVSRLNPRPLQFR